MNIIKYVVFIFTILFIFTPTFAAEYTVPRAAYSVYAEDLDLDGDKDIVVGHKTGWEHYNPTISILKNEGAGTFTIFDTSFVFCGYQHNIFAKNIDNDNYPDIVAFGADHSSGIADRYMRIFYNEYGFFNVFEDFTLNTSEVVADITYGDIDNDNDIDIVIASHHGQFWGVLYNNGSGQFSAPEYHYVDYHPGGIACGDLNNDGRDDIVVCGLKLEVYLSYPGSFQYILVDEPHYMGNVKIADMNNDGFNDIVTETWYVPGHYKDISIYFNNGGVNFNDVYVKVVEEAASELFVTDLNGDNYPDVIYNVSYSYPNSLYEKIHTYILYNNGNNTLQDPVNYQTYLGSSEYVTSFKSFAADLDNNSWNDIITVNYSYNESSIHILYNDSTGNFVEEPQLGINEECIMNNEKCKLSNYPNPFNPSTTIKFSIIETGFIELIIYDIKGRLIKRLISQKMKGGEHNVIWNGKDGNNKCCSSGIYLMNLKVNGKNRKTSKLILLK